VVKHPTASPSSITLLQGSFSFQPPACFFWVDFADNPLPNRFNRKTSFFVSLLYGWLLFRNVPLPQVLGSNVIASRRDLPPIGFFSLGTNHGLLRLHSISLQGRGISQGELRLLRLPSLAFVIKPFSFSSGCGKLMFLFSPKFALLCPPPDR